MVDFRESTGVGHKSTIRHRPLHFTCLRPDKPQAGRPSGSAPLVSHPHFFSGYVTRLPRQRRISYHGPRGKSIPVRKNIKVGAGPRACPGLRLPGRRATTGVCPYHDPGRCHCSTELGHPKICTDTSLSGSHLCTCSSAPFGYDGPGEAHGAKSQDRSSRLRQRRKNGCRR
jgi:hypothetical protein